MTKIAEAMKRVLTRQDPDQEEPVIVEIDRAGGADVFTVVYNPELVDDEALAGYRVKAAISSSLEGLARYNRQVKGKHGAYDSDELLFSKGYAQALAELEELVHLAPRPTPTPAQARALVKGWIGDEKMRATLATLFEQGGDESGTGDGDAQPAAAAGQDENRPESGGKRPRRGGS